MLNQTGFETTVGTNVPQILAFPKLRAAVGIRMSAASYDTVGTKKVVRAGTPVFVDLLQRGTTAIVATTTDSGTKGVYTVEVTTLAKKGDVITIEGINYTCDNTENLDSKTFAGTTIALQVESLIRIIRTADFIVAASGTTKVQFTQKIALTGDIVTAVAVQKISGQGIVISIATVTVAVTGTSTSNAVGVLEHDVDVTNGVANASLLIFGFVNVERLETSVINKLDAATRLALAGKITAITTY
jgi:hypothetical protein